jgi:Raf kinase inhibitor-like YbhB/YbcL family protein
MNLTILDFIKNNKINSKYICKNHKGENIMPQIKWNYIKNALSYAIIFEDPDTLHGNFVHMYIPYINKNICILSELNTNNMNQSYININLSNININLPNIIFGKNDMNKFGYHGPCAPPNTGIHRYIFTIYALDNILKINNDNIAIYSYIQFEEILLKNKINILSKDNKKFTYSYMNYQP